ncbi:MAG: glycoside hydrolase family 3 protein, partial [Candidatus Thorarchaeota archaeon]
MSKDPKRWINWDELKVLSNYQIDEKVKEILSILTLEEKMHQMAGDETPEVGGPKMQKRYNAEAIPAGVDQNLGIPGILFSDGPRGVVIGNSTCFPVSMARGASWDLALEEKIGNAIGIEAKAHGANYFGGVCINLLRHPAWGRAQETYGEDPYHLGEFGVALLKGVQNHIMACAKHYACNSIENTRFELDVIVDERTLREVYLPHFKKCVDAGVASIMSAYNKINGKYCGHNPHLLREILKQDWNFKGFVITDF